MSEPPAADHLPPAIERVLGSSGALGREEKMQALLHYAQASSSRSPSGSAS